MKIKLIESNFDRETGISYAKIQTDYGVFAGSAKLHEEDKEHVSSFAGCHYAETRAIIAYMKHRVKLLNERIESLENCKKVLENRKEYDHNSVENRTIRKQIYLLKVHVLFIITNCQTYRLLRYFRTFNSRHFKIFYS